MAVTLTTTGTNMVATPPAPYIIQGSYKCLGNATSQSLGLPFVLNSAYTVIQFSLNSGPVLQGGLAGATRLDPTEYFVVDGIGNLYLFTTLAATVSAYATNSVYSLNLVPANL